MKSFARLLIAPVFIFSGFVKAIDPLGSTYKFSDYFDAFGWQFLTPLAFPLAIMLSSAELLIGLCLLMGLRMRVTAWALLLFMLFFTILTLIIALTNPVTDCGCFGDAIILTNWQTFWKNIIFFVPTLYIFIHRNNYPAYASVKTEWRLVAFFFAVGIFISVFCYRTQPLLDFRPYKTGTDIKASMVFPDDAKKDSIVSLFIYEKAGKQQEFTLENIPYQDTGWKYIDRKDKLIIKGYVPPIHDFTITTPDGNDITDSVLADAGYSALIISYNLDKTNKKGMELAVKFAKELANKGAKIYALTASTNEAVFTAEKTFCISFYTCDEITLKTITRANPGILLIKDGVIVGKWNFRNLPVVKQDVQFLSALAISDMRQKQSNLIILASILSGILLLLITWYFTKH